MYFAGLASSKGGVGGVGGYSKGLRVKTNIYAWSFYAFAEDLVVFEVFTTES